jgi:hypothetical protein
LATILLDIFLLLHHCLPSRSPYGVEASR